MIGNRSVAGKPGSEPEEPVDVEPADVRDERPVDVLPVAEVVAHEGSRHAGLRRDPIERAAFGAELHQTARVRVQELRLADVGE